jgi:hypothetical protein
MSVSAPGSGTPLRIVATIVAFASFAAAGNAWQTRSAERAVEPDAVHREAAGVPGPVGADGHGTGPDIYDMPRRGQPAPIAAEAKLFRTAAWRADDAAPDRRPGSHPRTLATYRALRAYPGAPPRIPHGLTADEYRLGACRNCHERGGYSARFAAYAPVTPHPELTQCQQCHSGDATLMGVPTQAGGGPDAVCRQCHAPAAQGAAQAAGARVAPAASDGALDWRPAAWPLPARPGGAAGARLDGGPPPIPHDLQMREDCLACHSGPAAVEEIRTTHAERTSCRQCHVLAAVAGAAYARPAATGTQPQRGAQ